MYKELEFYSFLKKEEKKVDNNIEVKIIENNKIVFFIIKSFLSICIFAANDGLHPASPFRQYFHILKNAWYKILYHA